MKRQHKESLWEAEVLETQQINPATMTFHFRMSDGECHQKLTGTCSLDKPPATGERQGGEAGVHYCQVLYSNLERLGFKHPHVDIVKYRCGHYAFNDGQHRVCIAKRKGLELPALVSEEDDDCELCAPRKKSQYSRVTIIPINRNMGIN